MYKEQRVPDIKQITAISNLYLKKNLIDIKINDFIWFFKIHVVFIVMTTISQGTIGRNWEYLVINPYPTWEMVQCYLKVNLHKINVYCKFQGKHYFLMQSLSNKDYKWTHIICLTKFKKKRWGKQ